MPLFPSDFKKFKHVKSDKDTTTLRHPKGHEITIAHSALNKNMRAQLEALSRVVTDAETPLQKGTAYADGGYTEAARSGKLGTGPKIAAEAEEAKKTPSDLTKREAIPSSDSPKQREAQAKFDEHMKSQPKIEEPGEGMAEGGPVLYAEGDLVTPPEQLGVMSTPKGEIVGPQTSAQDTVSEAEQIDPELLRKREIYNNIVKAGIVNPADEVPAPPEAKMFGSKGEAPQAFSPQNWSTAEQMYQREKASNAADAAAAQQKMIAINSQRAAAGLNPLPLPSVPTGPQIPGSQGGLGPTLPQTGDQAQVQPEPQKPISAAPTDMEGMLRQGYQQRLAGIQEQQKAQTLMGQEQLTALQSAERAKTEALSHYQNQFDTLNEERLNLMHDIQAGHIDPEKFWEDHSRIATGIGIILSGFGGVAGVRQATDFLKYQIDQNIMAQRADLAKKENLLSVNMRQFGNLRDATDMTRIMQSDMLQNALQQAAAKATVPAAKAAALQAAGQLQMESAPLFQQFAMRRALMTLSQGQGSPGAIDQMLGYMRVTNPEMAKEMESRYVPGVGLASVPVPEKVRDEMIAHQKLQNMAQDVLSYSKKHTNIVPGTPEYNTGIEKAMILQQAIREGLLQTVFRESEKPLLEKFVDDNPAGAFKTLSTQPKLKTILQSNAAQLNILRSNYGLPKQAEAPQYKTVGGKLYMRGPNGEAIPVNQPKTR